MATAPVGGLQKGAEHAGVPQGQLQGGYEDRGRGGRRGLDRRVREEGPLAPRRQYLLREQEEPDLAGRGAARWRSRSRRRGDGDERRNSESAPRFSRWSWQA